MKLTRSTAIRGERAYRRALKEIEGLMTAKRGTPEGDRLDLLATMVEAREAARYPLDPPGRRGATRSKAGKT
jgi:HTH-type transcriptional regulator/antitoxin HigA